eukprot:6110798-Alexandrium_andersonii.AAC.1
MRQCAGVATLFQLAGSCSAVQHSESSRRRGSRQLRTFQVISGSGSRRMAHGGHKPSERKSSSHAVRQGWPSR